MLIVVVLPAPLGPRKPNTSPAATSKLTPRTASIASKDLRRSSTSMAMPLVRPRRAARSSLGARPLASASLAARPLASASLAATSWVPFPFSVTATL
jgi:hypothetical protein